MHDQISRHSSSSAECSQPLSASGLKIAILLFFFLMSVYLLTSTGRARCIDEIDPVMQSESLLLRHSTSIPQAVNSGIFFGKLDRNGIARSAWPAGHALAILPWSAFGHYVLSPFSGIPKINADLAFTAATCWSSAFYAALAVAISFLIFLRITRSPQAALVCSLLMAFSTPLFVYSGWLFPEPLTASIFVAATLFLFGSGVQPSTSRALAGALLLGFAIHIRAANLVAVLVFVVISVFLPTSEEKRALCFRTTAILTAVVGLSGILYLFRNYVFFGNPLDLGVPGLGELAAREWTTPYWYGFSGFLFSPGKSIFLFCPAIILGILGLPRLWQRNRALALLVICVPLSALALYPTRTQWEGGYCYGPRYFVPSMILLCLPIGTFFSNPPRWFRPAFWTAAILGFLVQVIGLAANVMEDMVRNHYYDAEFHYRFFYSPITGQIALIWKYLHTRPNQIGLGWDRWFILLRAAGASSSALAFLIVIFAAMALTFGLLTWKHSSRAANHTVRNA